MLKTTTSLPQDVENLIERTIGCCIEVHRALGPGLLETIYSRAVCIELGHAGLGYEREKLIAVSYREELLCHQRLDVVVASQLVLEIKSVERLNPVYHAQILNYMRLSKLRAGLLMNFNTPVLKDALKRFVL